MSVDRALSMLMSIREQSLVEATVSVDRALSRILCVRGQRIVEVNVCPWTEH